MTAPSTAGPVDPVDPVDPLGTARTPVGRPPVPGPVRRYAAVAVAVLALLLVSAAVTLAVGPPNSARYRLLAAEAVFWAVFAVAVVVVRRLPVRVAVPLVVVGAVLLQLVAVAYPPRSTDDYFRYAWDGRVQVSGVDPYRYTPTDPALAHLRDDWLFPPECRTPSPPAITPCTRMNHPTSPTIYPPVAQAHFALVHLLTRPLGADGGRDRTWQVTGALLATATLGLLILVLRRYGDPRNAVLWGWCPTVVLEAGNAAHVDVLAALFVVAALGLAAAAAHREAVGRAARRVTALAGVAFGAAVATKLLPLLLVPALVARLPAVRGWAGADGRDGRDGRDGARWRRWLGTRGLLVASAAGLVVVSYLPHVLAVGPAVLGFLPGYLNEEGYDGQSRFALFTPWLPERVAMVVGLGLLAAIALLVARRADPRRPWTGALTVAGAAFAVLAVTYPWYALLLVVLVALDGRAEWLALAAAAYPAYIAPPLGLPFSFVQRTCYGLAVAVVVVVHVLRARRRGVTWRAIPL